MPPKKKKDAKDTTTITATQLRALKSQTKASVKLHVDAQSDEQREKLLKCQNVMHNAYEDMKRKREDPIEVNQRLKALTEQLNTNYASHVDQNYKQVLSEEEIASDLLEARKTCDKATVLCNNVTKTLEQMKNLLSVCRHTRGSI